MIPGSLAHAAGSSSEESSLSGLRRDRPNHHEFRGKGCKQIVRVGFLAEPALVSRFGENERHAIMYLLDEVIRRHSDNSEGTNPFPALWMTPVLPKPSDGKGRTVLHGNGIGLLCSGSSDRSPLNALAKPIRGCCTTGSASTPSPTKRPSDDDSSRREWCAPDRLTNLRLL
jgi:hypothetical protein